MIAGGPTEPGESLGVMVFAGSDQAEQVAVGLRPERFCLVPKAVEAGKGKGRWPLAAIMLAQAIKRSQGDTIAAVEAVECGKELGFELGISG